MPQEFAHLAGLDIPVPQLLPQAGQHQELDASIPGTAPVASLVCPPSVASQATRTAAPSPPPTRAPSPSGSSRATPPTSRESAEQLAGLLMTAVRRLGG